MITLLADILLSLYIFLKILNHNLADIRRMKIAFGVVFSCLLVCVILALQITLPNSRFILRIVLTALFAGIATGTRINLALTASTISVGISYGLLLAVAFISNSLFHIFSRTEDIVLPALSSVLMATILTVILFRIRRFRKGMLFLQKKRAGVIGSIICGAILLIAVLINRGISAELGAWLIIGSLLCILGVIIWWRYGLTKLYRERVLERNAAEYEKAIADRDAQIKRILEDNAAMAKLIHRDNKLLPALYAAVGAFMSNVEGTQANGRRIMEQIEQLMEERAGIIAQSQRSSKLLPSTNDILLDGTMNFMLLKASEQGIDFDIVMVGNLPELVDTVVSSLDLKTLSADLIENAIIATASSELKRVLITLSAKGGIFELCVQDSGIPFEIGTFMDLGKKKASTYLHKGGSGIGFMTVFEILRKYGASIIITEHEPGQEGFTKSISIRFDGMGAYTVKTYRAAEFHAAHPRLAKPDSRPVVVNINEGS